MPTIIELDVLTGTTTERDLNEQELDNLNKVNEEEIQLASEALLVKEQQRVAAQMAIAHAKSLGFTEEMIAVMYPNLTMEA